MAEKVLGVVEALFDFKASDSVGVSFSRGDKITVYQQSETGWWEGSLSSGARGWFPSNFTTALGEEPKNKWIQQASSSGHIYYYNVLTGESSWVLPKDEETLEEERRQSVSSTLSDKSFDPYLPEGWTMHETSDGKVFYFNKTTKQASWTTPGEDTISQTLANAAAASKASDDLPANWFVKRLPDGRQYYYNKVTNETVWRKEDIAQLKKANDANQANSAAASTNTQTSIDALIKSVEDKTSRRDESWEMVTSSIVQAFAKLNEATKQNDKPNFVVFTKLVLNTIREMLIASATYDVNAPILLKNKVLANHHRSLTENLSKLVLSAKLASGVWPPPDANTKMQQVASEILIAVRHFIVAASDARVPINLELISAYNKKAVEQSRKVPPKIAPKPKLNVVGSPAYYKRTVAPALTQRFQIPASTPTPGVYTGGSRSPPVARRELSPLNPAAANRATIPPPLNANNIQPPPPIVAKQTLPPPVVAQVQVQVQPAPVQQQKTGGQQLPPPPLQREPEPEPEPELEPEVEEEPDDVEKAIIQEQEALQAQVDGMNGGDEYEEGDQSSMSDSYTESYTEPGMEDTSSEDAARITKLDEYSKDVLVSVEEIVNYVKKSGFQKSLSDQKLVILASKVVVSVGRILESADEVEEFFLSIHYNLTEFQATKTYLFDTISGLVGTARQATDPLAPPDALKQVMMGVQATVNAVHSLVIACKQLIELKETAQAESLSATLSDMNSDSLKSRRAYSEDGLSGSRLNLVQRSSSEEAPLGRTSSMDSFDDSESSSISQASSNDGVIDISAALKQGVNDPAINPFATLSHAPAAISRISEDDAELGRQRSSSKLVNFFGVEAAEPAAASKKKLTKFFGEKVPEKPPTPTKMPAPKKKTPAFLGVSYVSGEDLVFNMEGKVKGGTLDAMVERMTQHDVLDSEFTLAFLLTYRSFTTPRKLMDLIIARYNLQPPPDIAGEDLKLFNIKKLTPIRLRVTNVLKIWIENYFDDFKDDTLLRSLQAFIKTNLQSALKNPAEQLNKLIQKKMMGTMSRKMVFSGKAPLPLVSKSLKQGKFVITDLEPLEIARQLSLMESKLYNQIQPSECLNKAWSEPKLAANAEHIRAMIERSNQLTAWVVSTILLEENVSNRVKILKHFLLIAEKSRALNNFNSLMSILAGLSSAPVHRLKRTWTGLNSKEKKSIQNLRTLMDSTSNFATYRKTLHTINPPCVPFLGVYLTDLTFIEDGNKDMLNSEKSLINFDKRYKVAVVIREIQQYQTAQYCLQPVEIIEEFLLHKFRTVQPIDELYDLSLVLEPRETTDDTVLRLLAESGFF